ncbi:MAG: nucleotidyltransferase domain-containing protein [Halobacteriota archaeon]|nr:nucleotidyltransferase domain-containing protein [Halobacteriota archaeon]
MRPLIGENEKLIASDKKTIIKEMLEKELLRILDQLKQMKPEMIILFGSLARDDVGLSSDIDLIVIMETKERFVKRLRDVYENIDNREAVDILVSTPEEFENMKDKNPFIKDAIKGSKILYEKRLS